MRDTSCTHGVPLLGLSITENNLAVAGGRFPEVEHAYQSELPLPERNWAGKMVQQAETLAALGKERADSKSGPRSSRSP